MLDDLEIESTIKFAIYGLMLYLYDYGLEEIHLGGLMRLLGVSNTVAENYDNDIVVLNEEFVTFVQEITRTAQQAGQTLH